MFKKLFCKHHNIKVERFYNIISIYRSMGTDYVDIDDKLVYVENVKIN